MGIILWTPIILTDYMTLFNHWCHSKQVKMFISISNTYGIGSWNRNEIIYWMLLLDYWNSCPMKKIPGCFVVPIPCCKISKPLLAAAPIWNVCSLPVQSHPSVRLKNLFQLLLHTGLSLSRKLAKRCCRSTVSYLLCNLCDSFSLLDIT